MANDGSRAGAVMNELAARGMELALAQAVSDDLLARHPLARRLGVKRLTRELRELGLSDSEAREAALLLHALETLELGGSYGLALEELREAGTSDSCARQACLEASRIHRSCRAQQSSRVAEGLVPTSAVLLILATAVVVASAVVASWLSVAPS